MEVCASALTIVLLMHVQFEIDIHYHVQRILWINFVEQDTFHRWTYVQDIGNAELLKKTFIKQHF